MLYLGVISWQMLEILVLTMSKYSVDFYLGLPCVICWLDHVFHSHIGFVSISLFF